MTKRYKIALNSITLVILNIVYWFSNDYPRCILVSSDYAALESCLNLLFFVLYSYVLIIIFSKNLTSFDVGEVSNKESFFKRFHIGKLIAILALQTGIDLFALYVDIGIRYSYAVTDVIMLINWIFVYLILVRQVEKPYLQKRKLIGVVCILAITVAVILLYDCKLQSQYQYICEKYVLGGTNFVSYSKNLDFLHNISSLIFDSFIVFVFVVFHTSSTVQSKTYSNKSKSTERIRVTFRIGAVLVAAFLLIAVRMLVLPYGCVKSTDVSRSIEKRFVNDGTFYRNIYVTTFSRVGKYNLPEICYEIAEVEIYCDGVKTKEFCDVKGTNKYFVINENGISYPYDFTEYVVGDSIVYVYTMGAFCFVENGTAKTVLFSEIESSEQSETIIGMCKTLITEGNVAVFEYAASYLYQYDREFILPYIEKYAVCDFSANEKAVIEKLEYKQEYISRIAIRLLNEK